MAMIASWVKPPAALGATPSAGNDPGCTGIRTFYREGCSNPVPKLNHTPKVNGCGPQNGFNPAPQTPLGLATFTPACDEHDRGYGSCNRPKAVTDTRFLADMKAICAGPGTPVMGFVMNVLLYQCIRNAEIFYTAVSELGDDPYKEGQAEACECCDECAGGAPSAMGNAVADQIGYVAHRASAARIASQGGTNARTPISRAADSDVACLTWDSAVLA